ncbi:hypothetical protein L6164_033457 [Bauhinia variegata]|uniref:Uncharacterized protein n=1 Tax=Bauhinia variegata TaxID=167791 RepID=A0ACB9KRX1_BAUVA|nr:hypothetical protein L6164_033457 [Bauhinia variegata]
MRARTAKEAWKTLQQEFEGDSKIEVKGKGSIGNVTTQGGMTICGIVYVPALVENVLTIGQLLEHSYSLIVENKECRIFDLKGLVAVCK